MWTEATGERILLMCKTAAADTVEMELDGGNQEHEAKAAFAIETGELCSL